MRIFFSSFPCIYHVSSYPVRIVSCKSVCFSNNAVIVPNIYTLGITFSHSILFYIMLIGTSICPSRYIFLWLRKGAKLGK